MKLTALITTALLGAVTSASIASQVQDIIGSAKSSLNRLNPLTVSVQVPCCTKPPCPGCPAFRGNVTLGFLSISYPKTGLPALEEKPPGCGEDFSAEDCLRFFQVTLLTLDKPLGIAARKAHPAKEGDVRGCGEDSTPGECLRYLKGFFEEVRKPLERTLGAGAISDVSDGDDGECDDEGEKEKSEL